MLYLTRFKNSRGQGVVEFALMLPLILFLLILIIEAGLLLSAFVRTQNVSRETARQIAVNTSEAAIVTLINGHFGDEYTLYFEYTGDVDRNDASRGDTATVTATRDYEPLIGWTGLVIPEELSARSVMMIEN